MYQFDFMWTVLTDQTGCMPRPRCYKTFFMLNSAEHEKFKWLINIEITKTDGSLRLNHQS